MSSNIPFPQIVSINGRKFVERVSGEVYKAALLAAAAGGDVNAAIEKTRALYAGKPIELVPVPRFSDELGGSRRTFGRRMAEAAKAASATTSPAEVA